jgi:hypothetical protein
MRTYRSITDQAVSALAQPERRPNRSLRNGRHPIRHGARQRTRLRLTPEPLYQARSLPVASLAPYPPRRPARASLPRPRGLPPGTFTIASSASSALQANPAAALSPPARRDTVAFPIRSPTASRFRVEHDREVGVVANPATQDRRL